MAFEQHQTQIEKAQPGSQQAASQNLYADVMKSVPTLAKRLEAGPISTDETKNVISWSFENIYKSAGGGDLGKKAEDTFQNALNDQLKADGSQIHVDKAKSLGLVHSEQNTYAVIDESNGQYRSSGIFAPESAVDPAKAEAAAVKPGDAKPTTAAKAESPFADKQTEQLYNRGAEDAALAIMSKSLSPEQKAQGVIDAMNKIGDIKNGVALGNFEDVLSQKLGKNAKVGGFHSSAMGPLHGAISIDTGRGETLEVPFKVGPDGKLASPRKDN
jgi:hypothetical protein